MNKLLVLTGGTKGIGRSIIERFVADKFDIITCSRKETDLQILKSDIENLGHGTSIDVFKADLSVKEEVLAFIEFVNGLGRTPDVLINNTGVFFPGQVNNEAEGVMEKSFETNLYSAYRITRGFIRGMMDRRSGYIFNICSVASIEPYPRGASYCMSKFALLGMTRVLREEMKGYGIKVTAVIPGSTLTPTWDGVDLPEEDFMRPQDIAASIFSAYSLSDNSVVEEIVMRPQKGDV